MILLIEALVKKLAPHLASNSRLSLACLSTTNPLYLVFNEKQSEPLMVVKFANSEEDCQTHKIIEQLYPVVGDLIPEPIALAEFNGQKVAIQKGMKGIPWFEIAAQYNTMSQWNNLRNRAILALNRLHHGINSFPEWKKTCTPGLALRECLQDCLASGTILSEHICEQVELLSKKLDEIGTITTHPQHGDYCLNNLLVEPDNIHIIDFEDFGIANMPLHDEFALALSMYSFSPVPENNSLQQEIELCTKTSLVRYGLEHSMLPGFFAYHLILRLGSWSQGSRRAQYRSWLLSVMETFIKDPNSYFNQ